MLFSSHNASPEIPFIVITVPLTARSIPIVQAISWGERHPFAFLFVDVSIYYRLCRHANSKCRAHLNRRSNGCANVDLAHRDERADDCGSQHNGAHDYECADAGSCCNSNHCADHYRAPADGDECAAHQYPAPANRDLTCCCARSNLAANARTNATAFANPPHAAPRTACRVSGN